MYKNNLTSEQIFALGLQNHKKNNLKIAENLYNEILKKNPNHVETIFLLGTLQMQTIILSYNMKQHDLAGF